MTHDWTVRHRIIHDGILQATQWHHADTEREALDIAHELAARNGEAVVDVFFGPDPDEPTRR